MKIADISIGKGHPLAVICGPCVMESQELLDEVAKFLKERMPCPFVFKSSFDKANRSSIHSYRGPGIKKGLKWLSEIKQKYNIPVITDIHLPEQAGPVSQVCDAIQIPAFLCRQTDLLIAAAKTGKPVHVKKGQFLAPENMKTVVEKLREGKCKDILVTDRGSCFGYRNLVSDFRSIAIMKELGVPVCYDATHSVQYPGIDMEASGGDRRFVTKLAKASVCAGADALYMETHPNPDNAKCDAKVQMLLTEIPKLVEQLQQIRELVAKQESV